MAGNQTGFRAKILQNKNFLIGTLRTDHGFVLQNVHEHQFITQREYDNLKDIQNGENRIIDLLDRLMGKGDETCRKFIELLGEKSVLEAFPLLNGHCIFAYAKQETSDQDDIESKQYKISSMPRGTCVIINNVTFLNRNKEREGSDMDQESLEKVFTWLGFKVVKYRDQTAAQMKNILTDLGKKVDGDCFICCILSHGREKGVSGTDGRPVSVEEIREPFKCQSLAGKPKLFFIQACRGGKQQNTVKVEEDDFTESNLEEEDDDEDEEDDESFEIIPADSDFLIAFSTIYGYKSKRNRKRGSRFIQSLCRQLEEHCPQGTDIPRILVYVNDEVSQQGTKAKQMPIHEVALRKTLILPVPN